MGAYLSKPATEKKSSDVINKKMSCGISGMQGWRVSMEDAYNCIPEFDEDCSLFGVYDGHGGCEVALYCAYHFHEVLKQNEKYEEKNYEEALIETFMEMDRRITLKETIQELKVLADRSLEDGPPTEEDILKKAEEELPEENETELLHEEATMSIEDLLKRYGQAANAMNSALGAMTEEHETSSSQSQSEESKPNADEQKQETSNSQEGGSSSSVTETAKEESCGGSSQDQEEKKNMDNEKIQERVKVEETKEDVNAASGDKVKVMKKENKKITKVKEKLKPAKLALPDDEYVPPHGSDSEESEESFDSSEAIGGSEDESSEEDSEDEEDALEELRKLTNDNEDGENQAATTQSNVEEPGKDSGTTAVVALMTGKTLIVANAGDSRCVLSRAGGVAYDMSDDHKPEDEDELKRIQLAGGQVNAQGRVNGGLNLSRAIGDHCYKTNDKFDLKNQMITALPDLKTVELKSGDEFMILACDGIWNVLTSQEVIDFVRDRLSSNTDNDEFKVSSICEELFTRCLAPDTMGDGTGCDNMTCLIVRFNKDWLSTLQHNGVTEETNIANSVKENHDPVLNKDGQLSLEEIKTQSIKRLSDNNSEIPDENNTKRPKLV